MIYVNFIVKNYIAFQKVSTNYNIRIMTNEEKLANPEYKTTGGYLKRNDLKASYNNWWKNLTEEEKKIIKGLPNFNADKFKEITGITAI